MFGHDNALDKQLGNYTEDVYKRQGEQAKIQNTVVQLQLSTQLAEIQNKLLQQAKQDAQVKATIEDRGNSISAPDPITNWD